MKKRILTILFSALMAFGVGAVAAACNPPAQSSEAPKTTAVVHFDVNTDHETNVIKDKTVTIGKRVSKPNAVILDDNPTNLQVYGWYTSKDYTEQWDFKKGRVQEDMTLYAKWVELYDVNYYVNGAFLKTENVFNGDLLVEDATVVEGFQYLGSYTDEAHTQKVDFTKPVSGNMNVYVQRSAGIYLSDHVEDGQLSSGTLTDNVAAYLGTVGEGDEEGWVEEYTVETAYASGTVEEKCTYVNFGYTPSYGDPYIELCRSFDITQSQIIRVWYKNLGNAEGFCMYFTTMMDPDNNIYSETGMNYTQAFCYPNYTGNDGARMNFTDEQKNMDETAEWEYADFNLYEIYKNGYSVWGTSPYLGALRLQANYISGEEGDLSNEFLIKAIEGIPYDVPVEDSEEIVTMMDTAKGLSKDALDAAANAQTGNENGFVFPKDFACVQKVSENAEVINSTDGMLFYAEDEISARGTENTTAGFSVIAPEGKNVDLNEYTTLHLTLQNMGYADSLIVYVYNNENVPVKAEIDIAARMLESKTYTVNLYGQFGMEGTLKRVEVLYSSLGMDNLIRFEDISFGEFVPYDTVGLNFNDKFTFGFTSTSDIAVSFESDREGTRFDVSKSYASITSPNKEYGATMDGYAYATLNYVLVRDSLVTRVIVEYKLLGEFTTAYEYELNLENKGKANAVKLPLNADERGFVQAVRLTFVGTGGIIIKGIDYSVGETGLPFYKSYDSVYGGAMAEWFGGGRYMYDETLQASILVKDKSAEQLSCSMYIGYTASHSNIIVPHTTNNVPVTETTKLKIVYQNRTSTDVMLVNIVFSNTETGSGESGEPLKLLERHNQPIMANMAEYEWSVLTIEIPTQYVETYLAKFTIGFTGEEIAIRAVSIEN